MGTGILIGSRPGAQQRRARDRAYPTLCATLVLGAPIPDAPPIAPEGTMTRSRTLPLLAAVSLAVAPACQLERMFPEKVAAGVARLSFRNAAVLTSLVSADATCGFASEAVLASAKITGEVGSVGALTWTVE